MNLLDWIKSVPSSIFFKKRKFVEDIDKKGEKYHLDIPDYTIVAGFRINNSLLSKVLAAKYKQFKLTNEGEFKKSDRRWTKEELEKQNKK